MKEKLVSKEMLRNLSAIFNKKYIGDALINIVFKLGGIDKANAIYDASKHLTGIEFINDLLNNQQITRNYENIEVLDKFKNEAFIITSNHPYGHIDGLIEIAGIAAVRSDYKMMVNWLLMQIDTIEEFFIGVNPFPKNDKASKVKSSISGVKQCLNHLEAGHPLGIFPAGGISLPNLKGNVFDRDWQESPVKLIKKAKVPVIPVFISGANSLIYQLLGHISWKVRSAYLIHELANKKGKNITVYFGEPIAVEEQNKYKNIKDFAAFLRSKTYELKEK